MGMAEWFSLLTTLLCLEIALIFIALYLKISHRLVDLLFALLSLCLAWMMFSQFMFEKLTAPLPTLFWLRMTYTGAFAAAVVLFHFVSAVLRQPMRFPWLFLNYLVGALLIALVWTEWFFRLPAEATFAGPGFAGQVRGPLYSLTVLVLLLALAAWGWLMHGVQRQKESAFAPLAHFPLLFLGGALVILGGLIVGLAILFFPRLHLPIGPHTVAITLFCLLTAIALGKEILHTERERYRLTQLLRFRDEAVRDVAHELKNPLAVIEVAARTVLEGMESGTKPETQKEMLQRCLESCRRLKRLLHNMLDTARLEVGREVELRLERTDLSALVQAVVEEQQMTTLRHRLLLQNELDSVRVQVDGDKIFQILSNLLDNAIKYSPDGGEIKVRLWEQENEIRISVSDQGIGMKPAQMARLFQPFERVLEPDRKLTGTGIGLHLVKQLIEAHGGRIWVESIYGQGSTFTFSLPKREETGRPSTDGSASEEHPTKNSIH